jgi:hypothetical protein
MILETGTIVFLSLLVLVWRLPRKTMLRLFGTPWLIELPFGLLAYLLHWGTFSGMMAAAVAAILCFGFVQAGRATVGFIKSGQYYPGFVALEV